MAAQERERERERGQPLLPALRWCRSTPQSGALINIFTAIIDFGRGRNFIILPEDLAKLRKVSQLVVDLTWKDNGLSTEFAVVTNFLGDSAFSVY